ncbi:MAG: hypothetical protein WD844_09470 [Thermoleophilaceae bacterium]
MPSLHPAENRGYRELYAFSGALVAHWPQLAARLGPGEAADALEAGVEQARALLTELSEVTARHGLHGRPAAQGVGQRMAGLRNHAADRFLERNQALRFAAQEAQHLSTLAGYLGEVAESRGDDELAGFARGWERRLRRMENTVRKAAIAHGSSPDAAVEPLDPSPVGRAAHGVGQALGTVGEWVDRRAARARE